MISTLNIVWSYGFQHIDNNDIADNLARPRSSWYKNTHNSFPKLVTPTSLAEHDDTPHDERWKALASKKNGRDLVGKQDAL